MTGNPAASLETAGIARKWRPLLWIVGVILVAAALLILYSFNPAHETFFPRCPLYSTTGLYCPGCGATRCLHHLLHGRVATAFRYNPFVPWVMAYLVGAGVVYGLQMAGVRIPLRTRPIRAGWIWALFTAILTFAVLRNIPVAPFNRLAPPSEPAAIHSQG